MSVNIGVVSPKDNNAAFRAIVASLFGKHLGLTKIAIPSYGEFAVTPTPTKSVETKGGKLNTFDAINSIVKFVSGFGSRENAEARNAEQSRLITEYVAKENPKLDAGQVATLANATKLDSLPTDNRERIENAVKAIKRDFANGRTDVQSFMRLNGKNDTSFNRFELDGKRTNEFMKLCSNMTGVEKNSLSLDDLVFALDAACFVVTTFENSSVAVDSFEYGSPSPISAKELLELSKTTEKAAA